MKPEKYAIFQTCLGWCGIAYGKQGIIRIYLPEIKKEKLKKTILSLYKNIKEDSKSIKKVINNICLYFKGNNPQFDFPIDMEAMTKFEKKVYKKTMKIPFGKIKTYKWLAEKINVPGGARAAGNALGRNPIPLIIPCHRVLRSNGTLGGFSAPGGLPLKKKMLFIEGHRGTVH